MTDERMPPSHTVAAHLARKGAQPEAYRKRSRHTTPSLAPTRHPAPQVLSETILHDEPGLVIIVQRVRYAPEP
jgi:hypothetical protein